MSRLRFCLPLVLCSGVAAAQTPTPGSGRTIPAEVLQKAQELGVPSPAQQTQLENALRWSFKPEARQFRVSFHQTVSLSGHTVDNKPVREEWERGYTQNEKVEPQAEGCRISAVVTHNEAFRNGRAEIDPIKDALMGKTLHVELDAEGGVRSVAGVEEAIAAIKTELSAEALEPIRDRLNPEGLADGVKKQYLARYEELRDRPLLEEAWIVHGQEFRTPVGMLVPAVTATTLDGFEELGGKRCARIRVELGGTPQDFESPPARAAIEKYFATTKSPPAVPAGVVTGNTLYWFEVDTGLMRRIIRDVKGASRRRRASSSENIHFTMRERTDLK